MHNCTKSLQLKGQQRWFQRPNTTRSAHRRCCPVKPCGYSTSSSSSSGSASAAPAAMFSPSYAELWRPTSSKLHPSAPTAHEILALQLKGRLVVIRDGTVDVRIEDGKVPAVRAVLQCFGSSDPAAGLKNKEVPPVLSGERLLLEVHGHSDGQVVRCVALSPTEGFSCGDVVREHTGPLTVPVGDGVCGRVLTALGHPADGKPMPPSTAPDWAVYREAAEEEENYTAAPRLLLPTGVKMIDFLTPLQKGGANGVLSPVGPAGQALWLLLARLARHALQQKGSQGSPDCQQQQAHQTTTTTRAVWALAGREQGHALSSIAEPGLLEQLLQPDSGSVVVCGKRSDPPVTQNLATLTAVSLAEWWRDQKQQDVLFVMDDVYGYAQNCTDLSTALRRPPCMGGYSPTLAMDIAALQERLVSTPNTALTTLQLLRAPRQGDMVDPFITAVAPHFDSLLVLDPSRHDLHDLWPPLNILQSVSRVLDTAFVGERHCELAKQAKALLERQKQLLDVVAILGIDELSEEDQIAVGRAARLQLFLSQAESVQSFYELSATLDSVEALLEGQGDDMPESAFYQVRTFDEAVAKGLTRLNALSPRTTNKHADKPKGQDWQARMQTPGWWKGHQVL
eukprot:gb/GEZN01003548.1/.p1 GENE.gb/GEZN01003548.1/~~gb/GEZN01003548.1/.p1  ORF type:complete len:623 (-),score=106.32 gb/GEZN01003548.1/:130-1998(-)